MDFFEAFRVQVSQKPEFSVLWKWLLQSETGELLAEMQRVMQNPRFHGEGDVFTHTKMVCEALVNSETYELLPAREQAELLLSAALHDVGKIRTTFLEDGQWVSPHHSSVGSRMARTFLWQKCGLGGTEEKMKIREAICGLIRYHMLPLHMINQEDAVLRIRQAASLGELAEDFSWDKLLLLAAADVQGRLGEDLEECRERVELCRLMAEESGCLHGAFSYGNSSAKHGYLSGRRIVPELPFYDDTWGEVVLMAGLPGTGKDTWISAHLPGFPMISLDDIRKEMGIRPTDHQGKVIWEARERAKIFLRRKQPFVWNATNLSREIRQKQVRLFEQYGAAVRIVYLETGEEIRRERNLSRKDAVPENVVEKLIEKTEPPTPEEALHVEWVIV